jgi:hypothetical protein
LNPKLDLNSETEAISLKLTRDDALALRYLRTASPQHKTVSSVLRDLIRREAVKFGIMKRSKSRKTSVVSYKLTA